MVNRLRHLFYLALLIPIHLMSQSHPITWSEFSPLPDPLGFAGMYAGVSNGALIALGGANFPEKYPWEGGKKKWHDRIFIMKPGGPWHTSDQKMPEPAAYGVSVSYGGSVILAGGCTETAHLSSVSAYQWAQGSLTRSALPHLPTPLAYMTGAVLGDALVILGGTESPTGTPTKTALLLDLSNPGSGWQTIEPWPGPERMLPASGVWNDRLILMGGENSAVNAAGEKYRHILQDGYALTLAKEGNEWKALWKTLGAIPRGVSAAGTIPAFKDRMIIWGGVDAVTAQYRTASTHPGITKSLLYYYPASDTWEYSGENNNFPSRVTLPVVSYQDSWLYVSGEIKPGIRTPSIIQIKFEG